jgi:hypothetical protein
MLAAFAGILFTNAEAQKKAKKYHSKKSVVKTEQFKPREFGTPTSVADITDEADSTREYSSIQNLVENNGVTLSYADSTFRPKEPLRRGDFIVSFSSALDAIKKAADAGGVDSSVVTSNYDKSQSYVTSMNEITDLKENSIYYPATQSLVEKWGIAPVSKTKSLNAGEIMTEGEVYDILKSTLGYTSPGTNPYTKAMTRGKFAMILNNAVNEKLSQINEMASVRTDSLDNARRQQELALKQQEKQATDSLTRPAEQSKIDAQKQQAEAWTKLSEREKRKQIRSELKSQKNK